MKRLLSVFLMLSAVSLLTPRGVSAAFVFIDDTSFREVITFNLNDFEFGFSINGTEVQRGLNNFVSVTLPESDSNRDPITYTFSGSWIDLGQTVARSDTVYFLETDADFGPGVSDILVYNYTTNGQAGLLEGSFVSDSRGILLDANGDPIVPPPGATTFDEALGVFDFSNAFITAGAASSGGVPEPSSLTIAGLGGICLVFYGVCRRRHVTA